MKPYLVLENFLEEKYFNSLKGLICSTKHTFPWYWGPYEAPDEWQEKKAVRLRNDWEKKDGQRREVMFFENDPLAFFFTHLIYHHDVPVSPHYQLVHGLIEMICKSEKNTKKFKTLVRCRINYFQNYRDGIVHEYPMHVDSDFSHSAAILSLNTCDGYTKLEDGTKIPSVANQLLVFDAGEKHCSTTTTNAPARFNIIVNYL